MVMLSDGESRGGRENGDTKEREERTPFTTPKRRPLPPSPPPRFSLPVTSFVQIVRLSREPLEDEAWIYVKKVATSLAGLKQFVWRGGCGGWLLGIVLSLYQSKVLAPTFLCTPPLTKSLT